MLGRPRHNPSVEARASAPAATLKLHFHRIAPLQGRVMPTKPERARVSRAEKRKLTKTPLWEEVKASAPAAIPKLHFHRRAGLQERRKVNPQRASGPAKKQPVAKTPRLVEARANAPVATRKLHSHRKARLQGRVPQNKILLPRWARAVLLPTLTRKERGNNSC